MLDEATHWVVNGGQGQALCSAASLRQAIEIAHHYATSGVADQIDRLRQGITAPEKPSVAA
jgi:hypothetical protein